MARRSLANTIYLEWLTFSITMLLAASDVWAEGGNDDQSSRTSNVVGGVTYNNHSVCYDSKKQQVKCTKQKIIVVGSVISSLFVLLGVIYLYATCSDRRKKRKGPPVTDENEPLSHRTGTISDFEKGFVKANKTNTDESDGGPTLNSFNTGT